jgi:DNA-binding NarL/FixJ family response regulator
MRILLVEDHKPTREVMRALLEEQADMQVVGEAPTGEDAVSLSRDLQPDIVVMDILLPRMNGIEATRKILAAQPNVKVLALSNHFGESLVQAILDAGGLGYVQKSMAFEELIPALRTVAAGKSCIGRAAANRKI